MTDNRSQFVQIDKIIVDQENHRRRGNDDAAIEELMDSMRRDGLLQPIGVTQDLLLIYGHRRLEAAKRLGWGEIAAVAHQVDTDVGLHTLRLEENLRRLDLSAMEEAIGVSLLVGKIAAQIESQVSGCTETDAIEEAANQLGRPMTWVRDRAYLARLTGKTMQALMDGDLTLGHARELAKIADEKARDKITADAIRYGGDSPNQKMRIIRGNVERSARSLRGVPWLTDFEFAGAVACDGCPSNSVNDVALFEHDQKAKAAEAPTCLDPACYRKKEKTVNLSIDKSLVKVKKRVEQEELVEKLTISTIGDLRPPAARPTTFVNRARKLLDMGVAKPGKKTSSSAGSSTQHNRVDLYSHRRKWADDVAKRVAPHLDADPIRRVVTLAIEELAGWNEKEVAKFIASPAWKESVEILRNPTVEGLRKLLATAIQKRRWFLEFQGPEELLAAIAEVFGEEVPPVPTLKSIQAQEKAKKKTAGKKATKKKTSKKKGRKAVAS